MTAADRESVAVDYSVIDHLYRIETGTYKGANAIALGRFRRAAEGGNIVVWVAEITPVEMLQGREKVMQSPETLEWVSAKDERKVEICRSMNARYLAYPCSKLDDTYSRLGMSFRLAGPESHAANAFEERLLTIPDVSPGDARQLTSCAFPVAVDALNSVVKIQWFVAEDALLIAALRQARLPELAHVSIGSSSDWLSSHHDLP